MPGCEVQVCHFGLMQVSHIGETGQNLHGPTYERTQQAQMIGDPGWPEKTKRRNLRYTRSQTVESAEYSCSLNWSLITS